MVSITVFSMMLVVLCIGTAVGAPTKRQSSDDNENGLDMNRAIIMLQKVATNLMKSSFSPNITDDVRFAVCILRDFHWSRGDIDESNFSALVSVKKAVINDSCSWLSSSPDKSYSCEEMCNSAEVMFKMSNMLHETLVWYAHASPFRSCDQWIDSTLGGYREEILNTVRSLCTQ
ncbi:hypothetical protein EMCRGX_G017677 [Ephydatia muelleri]|eukprot:Em0012g195a